MAELDKVSHDADKDEEETLGYQPPAEKSIDELLNLDAEDESLRKYKEALLGSGMSRNVIVDPKNPNKVIIVKLSLLVEGRDEISLDLTRPAEEIKKKSFTLKEGCRYKIKVYFYVQREIVSGLRYEHKVHKKGIPMFSDRMKQMMGSYGPKEELQSFTTQESEAPSGMMAKGEYMIKSKFVDDDKNEFACWEWPLEVRKDW